MLLAARTYPADLAYVAAEAQRIEAGRPDRLPAAAPLAEPPVLG